MPVPGGEPTTRNLCLDFELDDDDDLLVVEGNDALSSSISDELNDDPVIDLLLMDW